MNTRTKALTWLVKNYRHWPLPGEMIEPIGPVIYKGWQFVAHPTKGIVFANSIEPAITRYDWQVHRGFLRAMHIAGLIIGCAIGSAIYGVFF